MDPLTILIEANTSGLETQLKKGLTTVTSFIDQMNSQEIDWQSILAGSLDTAMIAGIASTFAEAIISSIQFEGNAAQLATQLGAASGGSTAFGQSGAANSAAISASNNTGQNATDVQTSIASFLPILGNVQAATEAANETAELAAEGFGSMGDITQSLIPIFQQWGVTTSAQVQTVMNDILNAGAAIGPGMFVPVANALASWGPSFTLAGANVSNLKDILATFGATAQSSGLAAASSDFTLLGNSATGMSQAGIALASMAGGAGALKQNIVDGNVPQAMDLIAKAVQSMSTIELSNFGIDPTTANSLDKFATDFPSIQKTVTAIEGVDWRTIDQSFQDMSSASVDLQKDWQQIKNLLTSPDISTAVDAIAKGIGVVVTAITGIVTTEGPEFSTLFTTIGTAVTTIAGMVKTVWDTLGLPGPKTILDGMLTDFNEMVNVIKLLVDGFSLGVTEIGAIAAIAKDIVTLNWKDVGTQITNLANSPAENQFLNDWDYMKNGGGIVPGTTAQGAILGASILSPETLIAPLVASNASLTGLSSILSSLDSSSVSGTSASNNQSTSSSPSSPTTTNQKNVSIGTINLVSPQTSSTAGQSSPSPYSQFMGLLAELPKYL